MTSDDKNNLINSVTHALKPTSLIAKLFVMSVFITILAIDKLAYYGDKALEEGTSILLAFYQAYRFALLRAFGSVYPVLQDIVTFQFSYWNEAKFSFFIAIFFALALMYIVYQPIDLILNMFDGNVGKTTSLIFRIVVTFLVVVVISAFVYYGLGEHGIIQNIMLNETITNTTITNTSISDIPVIDLI